MRIKIPKHRIVRVIDGDTFVSSVDMEPRFDDEVSIRIGGVDCPEIKGETKLERELAQEAKRYLEDKLKRSRSIELKGSRRDMYGGRYRGPVYIDGKCIAKELIAEGLGRVYNGGKRKKGGWRRRKKKVQRMDWKRFLICAAVAVAIVAGVVVFINGA